MSAVTRVLVLLWFVLVAPLQAQVVFGPQPVVTFQGLCPPKEVLIGETVTFDITFENAGDAEGFWPFVDLVLDQGGADHTSSPCDGMSFLDAQVISTTPPAPLQWESLVIQTAGCAGGTNVTHPYGPSGVTLPALPPGAQLAVLKLPFGSFEPGQPAVTIRVTVKISDFADEGHPLRIRARGGFRLGDDEFDDPTSGVQPILLPEAAEPLENWPFEEVIPRVVKLSKKFAGNEQETVPGPNFLEDFQIRVDVAPGQTIHNFVVSDGNAGPAQIEFTKIVSTIPAATTSIQSNGGFTVDYPSLTGTAGNAADVVRSTFYAKDIDGCLSATTNLVYAGGGSWKPLDPRDPAQDVFAAPGSDQIDVKALATDKTVTLALLEPGGLVEYRIRFRISDYEQFRDIVVEDFFSDGQEYVSGSASIIASDGTGMIKTPFPENYLNKSAPVTAKYFCPSEECGVINPGEVELEGSTHLVFRYSDALKALQLPFFQTGVLTGGQLTGGGPAIGEITFMVNIRDDFQYGPHSTIDEKSLDKHDPVFDRAIVHGTIVGPGMQTCTDDSSICEHLPGGPLEKRIVAKNGQLLSPVPDATGANLPKFTVGDLITFRIVKTVPTGDAEELIIRDWVPQPVLKITGMATGTLPYCGALPPGENQACLMAPSIVPQPQVTIDATEQSITFDFGNLDNKANTPVTIEIWFTLRVAADPFADGLFLTNHAEECESNSYGAEVCLNAIAQFELTEPLLRIRKGVLCAGPGCPPRGRASGARRPSVNCTGCPAVITNSNDVGSLLQASTYADAGDHITFAVVVENIGNGPLGAFDILFQDQLKFGSPGELDLASVCLRYGDGTDVPIVGSLLTPTSLAYLVKHLDAYSPTSGRNLIVLTYTVDLFGADKTPLGSCVENKAVLMGYSNQPDGQNFVTAGFTAGASAESSACVKSRELKKTIVSKSEHPNDPLAAVWIGEVVKYRLLLQVPEGTAAPLEVTDHLPAVFTMIAPPVVTSSGASSMTWSAPTWTPNGLITFASVVNGDDDAGCEYLVIEIEARVENVAANNDKDVKPNSFSAKAPGGSLGTSNVVTVPVAEARLEVTKHLLFDGEYNAYRIIVKNEGTGPAFDVELTDVIGSCIGPMSIEEVKPDGNIVGLNVFPLTPSTTQTATAISMAPGSSVTIFTTTHDAKPGTCTDCAGLTNTARVSWTSLPGDGVHPASAAAERTGSGSGSNDNVDVATTTRCGMVCGSKFEDLGGGVLKPIAGWKIDAIDEDGNTVASTTTGADGKYCLTLLKGFYRIAEEKKQGWTIISPVDPSGSGVYDVEIDEAYTVDFDADFVNRPGCTADISGTVWDDKNQNGLRDTGEPPPWRWDLFASPTSGKGSVAYTTVTDDNGKYQFSLPGPETYDVQALPQDGWLRTYPKPVQAAWKIEVKCNPTSVVAPVAQTKLDFGHTQLCGPCEPGTHCEPQNGILTCIADQNTCPVTFCAPPAKRCIYVNGLSWCVP